MKLVYESGLEPVLGRPISDYNGDSGVRRVGLSPLAFREKGGAVSYISNSLPR
jgi:hypothetical protein